jgi:dTDP-4-amino-4,6-dideoxygalactose transaminase
LGKREECGLQSRRYLGRGEEILNKERIYLSPPHMTGRELELVKQAFDSNFIAPCGPMVNGFEEDLSVYIGGHHCAALSSGTAALHLALLILGVKPEDEVICSSFTFAASANPIVYCGAAPVFVDSEAETWNMDPVLLEEAIVDRKKKTGRLPAAVIVTHLYGMPAKLDEILQVIRKYDITLIEDAAEALGARYGERGAVGGPSASCACRRVNGRLAAGGVKEEDCGSQPRRYCRGSNDGIVDRRNPKSNDGILDRRKHSPAGTGGEEKTAVYNPAGTGGARTGEAVGTFGVMGVYSFNGNKIITSSGGGALVSSERKYIEEARFLASQARDQAPHYEHSRIGYNYRMSNVVAAIGRGQLEALDSFVGQCRQINQWYRQAFERVEGIEFLDEPGPRFSSNYWLTTIKIDSDVFRTDRQTIREALEAENIESRPLWKPMHMQPVYKQMNAPVYGGKVSEGLFRDGLCLPSGVGLSERDVERIAGIVKG